MGMRHSQTASSPSAAQRVLDPASQFKVAYVEPAGLARWLDRSGTFPLGVVAFGAAPLPVALPCPVIEVALPLLDGPGRCEVWSSDHPVRFRQDGDISIAVGGDLLFGSMTAQQNAGDRLDHTTEKAYRRLLRLLRESGFPYLWRIWNYFPRINEEEQGLERYRLFCMGRHEALVDQLPGFPESLPAGTAVGTQDGPLQIYFLAGAHPATHLGNPRQINAYDYPKVYGPRSPSFARATLCRSDSATHLFISGTASVVGHQSRHVGLADLQALETVKNLRALIDRAQAATPSLEPEAKLQSVFKVYVRSAKHLETVRAVLQVPFLSSGHLVYLQGDLCRKELLVEIEGLMTTD
jgi:chorismate lyase / 3-hydroxybenzoate synthase